MQGTRRTWNRKWVHGIFSGFTVHVRRGGRCRHELGPLGMSVRRRIRLADTEVPVSIAKPIRDADLRTMTVSGEGEAHR
jgi:hypothetical protein